MFIWKKLLKKPRSATTVGKKLYIAGNFTSAGTNNVDLYNIQNLAKYSSVNSVVTTFKNEINDAVLCIEHQSDGKVLIGGAFSTINGVTRNKIARLNADGTVDTSFTANINNIVNSIKQLPDGKILVGGVFGTVNGSSARPRLVKLNADGTTDTTFAAITGINGSVSDIAFANDGKILVCGSFTAPTSRVFRLNSDYTLDTSFTPPTIASTANTVAVQSDGKVLLGGTFNLVDGVNYNRFIRLNSDGTIDTSFTPNVASPVNDISIQSDGKILIAGEFDYIGPAPSLNRRKVARINSDGTPDASFPNLNINTNVNSLYLRPDGNFIIGFSGITDVAGQSRGRIALINSDGTVGARYVDVRTATGVVNVVSENSSGEFFFGGTFLILGEGVSRNRILRLDSDGQIDLTYNPNSNQTIDRMTAQADGKLIVAGAFNFIGGVSRNRIARVNADGTIDVSFNANVSGTVADILPLSDGKTMIVGSFTSVGGVTRRGLARLNGDGSLDTSFPEVLPNPTSAIFRIIPQADNKFIIAGGFTQINGVSVNRIARINSDGTLDTSFTTSINGNVNILQNTLDGKILVAGAFTTVNSITRSRIAKINTDGSLDGTFVGPTISSDITAVAEGTDGKFLIGGFFVQVGGLAYSQVARLNSDGSVDTSFINTQSNAVTRALIVDDEYGVLIGGQFTLISYAGKRYPYLAGDLTSAVDFFTNDSVQAMLIV